MHRTRLQQQTRFHEPERDGDVSQIASSSARPVSHRLPRQVDGNDQCATGCRALGNAVAGSRNPPLPPMPNIPSTTRSAPSMAAFTSGVVSTRHPLRLAWLTPPSCMPAPTAPLLWHRVAPRWIREERVTAVVAVRPAERRNTVDTATVGDQKLCACPRRARTPHAA